MGYKKMDNSLEFADLALATSLKHNRSLKIIQNIDAAIDWLRVEQILMAYYTVGICGDGADAYPPLMLFKCMLLQKCFRINSDTELENQICPVFWDHRQENLDFQTSPIIFQR